MVAGALEADVIIDEEKLRAFVAKDSFDTGQRAALAKDEAAVEFENGRRSAWRTLETELPNLQWEPHKDMSEFYRKLDEEPRMPRWLWGCLAVVIFGSTLQIVAAFMKVCHPTH